MSGRDAEVGSYGPALEDAIFVRVGTNLCTYGFSVTDPVVCKLTPGDRVPHGAAAGGGVWSLAHRSGGRLVCGA